jgi:phospholipase/lecithinase/hemolysin
MSSFSVPFAGRLTRGLAALGLALTLPLAQAAAPSTASFSQLIVFGDSLSDTGNTQAVLGTNAFIANLAGYGSNGRFSNGPVWHEPMSTTLGLPLATRSRSGGSNYAHGGARVDLATGQSEGVITQFNSFINGPAAGGADPNALYALWAGGNDARDLVSSANPSPGVASSISALSGVLTGLISSGASTFIVPNLPDLGRIPENRNTPNQASGTLVSNLWNAALLDMLVGVTTTTGASIYFLDVFTTFNDVLDNPANFGFVNTTGQCRSVTNFGFTEVSCANPDTWVFWDAIHPTRAAHALVGARAADLILNGSPLAPIPEPATLLQLALGLALLGAWAQRRRVLPRR